MKSSWKTTVFGLMSAIGAGITGAYLVDPKLLSPFPAWLPGLAVLLSSIGTACLGLAARDNNKTSEQVGAGTPAAAPAVPRGAALLLAGLLTLGIACGGLQGCATPNRNAYVAVGVSDVSVTAAMGLWNDYVGIKHPSAETELAVKKAFEDWQASMLLVCDAGAAYSAGGGTNSLALQYAVSRAGQTSADLKTLLTSLGVKLP